MCCKKENSTLRQADFYQHEEIQKNRQGKLILFLLTGVLLSLLCFFKLPLPTEMRVSCSGARINFVYYSPLFTNDCNWFFCKTQRHLILHPSLHCPYLLATHCFFLLTFVGFSSVPPLSFFLIVLFIHER